MRVRRTGDRFSHPMAYTNITSAVFIAGPARMGHAEAGTHGTWEPNTDVYITEEGLIIVVEVAGIRGEDVEVVADGNRLHIRGERPDVQAIDRKSTRLNSSHSQQSRMPSSA